MADIRSPSGRLRSGSLDGTLVGEGGWREWRLGRRLIRGVNRDIYLGRDVRNVSREVAVKIEHDPGETSWSLVEWKVYQELSRCNRIPKIHVYGKVAQMGYHYLVMELLGRDLLDLFRHCSLQFSLKTILMLGRQMMSCLQQVHDQGLIHGDVTPENFVMGRGVNEVFVHLVSFTRASRYCDPLTRKHVEFEEDKPSPQTIRYASLNAHARMKLSRRDDLEALGYILVFFFHGSLPWQNQERGSEETKEQRLEKMSELKKSISIEGLCSGMPTEFVKYLKYCRNLRFEEDPDYNYLRALLDTAFLKGGYTRDGYFDWFSVQLPEYMKVDDECITVYANSGQPDLLVGTSASASDVKTELSTLDTNFETQTGASCKIGTSIDTTNTNAGTEAGTSINNAGEKPTNNEQSDMESKYPNVDPNVDLESNMEIPENQQIPKPADTQERGPEVLESGGATACSIHSSGGGILSPSIELTSSDSEKSDIEDVGGDATSEEVDGVSSLFPGPLQYVAPSDGFGENSGDSSLMPCRMRALLSSPQFELENRSLLDRMNVNYASSYDACRYGGTILTRAWPGGIISTIHSNVRFLAISRDSDLDPSSDDPENPNNTDVGNHHPPVKRETAAFVADFYRRPGEFRNTISRFRRFSHSVPLETSRADRDHNLEQTSIWFNRLKSCNETL